MERSKECFVVNGPPPDFLQAIALYAMTTHYRRGAAIYYAGDPADHWYLVAAGIAVRSALLSDGRRQIVELLLPGNFFGFTSNGVHNSTVEVVTDQTTIVRYSSRSVEALAESNPKLARQLRELAFEAIRRLDDRVVTVGRMNAVEKVGAFLIEMAERSPHDLGDRIALPLSRYEIADYLGLSMETVSRSISELKRQEAISLHGPHRIKVLNRQALRTE
jgi:CRP/FNR family transcriptional regulator, nitrogen fixation regulation protein